MPHLSELEMYKLNQPELVKKYEGKIIALKNGEVQGIFESKVDALAEMKKKFAPGSFMIIKCTPGEDEYTRRYRSLDTAQSVRYLKSRTVSVLAPTAPRASPSVVKVLQRHFYRRLKFVLEAANSFTRPKPAVNENNQNTNDQVGQES